MVIGEIRSNDTAKMHLAQHDDVIQALSTNRSDEALYALVVSLLKTPYTSERPTFRELSSGDQRCLFLAMPTGNSICLPIRTFAMGSKRSSRCQFVMPVEGR
jgi:hypothetical protein